VRTGWLPLCGWGLALVLLAVFGTAVFGLDTLPTLIWAGAGAACIATGGLAWLGRRRGPERPAVVVDSSFATVAVATGITMTLCGAAAVGTAVLWPGVGVTVLGLAGLVRELRAARRLRGADGPARAAGAPEPTGPRGPR
jgi:hypothetical protein